MKTLHSSHGSVSHRLCAPCMLPPHSRIYNNSSSPDAFKMPCTASRHQAVPDRLHSVVPSASLVQVTEAKTTTDAPAFGFKTVMENDYYVVKELARGGNGIVRIVRSKAHNDEFACKSIPKVLPSEASAKKREMHADSLLREIQVMSQLKGSLNVVKLQDVYEDDTHVHIIMEYCKGGELCHRIGERHYSERTVASFMRDVLRTLAQCHAHHILHRDVKPGNFMLLNDDDTSPLKAIDFGLAVPFNPAHLPRTDLGVEGTPWYMAPETLGSNFLPASDIWSAGVMAYQLLSGRFPFDDRKNSLNPGISAIFKSVLTDPINFSKPYWSDISDSAKDFVRMLLQRDPAQRPSAKEALMHPWLVGNDDEDRLAGKSLCKTVVQRIQRFNVSSKFKRTVLQLIADELVSRNCVDSGSSTVVPNELLQTLRLDAQGTVDVDKLEDSLRILGFKLDQSELDRLVRQLDPDDTGAVDGSTMAASQIDWGGLQRNNTEAWLRICRDAFSQFDVDHDGRISVDEIINSMRESLPPQELYLAIQQVMTEAGKDNSKDGLYFDDFVQMLDVSSMDGDDIYDDRISQHHISDVEVHACSRNDMPANPSTSSQSKDIAAAPERKPGNGFVFRDGTPPRSGSDSDSEHPPSKPSAWRFDVPNDKGKDSKHTGGADTGSHSDAESNVRGESGRPAAQPVRAPQGGGVIKIGVTPAGVLPKSGSSLYRPGVVLPSSSRPGDEDYRFT